MVGPRYGSTLCLAAMATMFLLAGCGGEDKKKPASQVAARVNKEEISVHQINAVLARAGQLPPDQTERASREVLGKLVDQELLVQKAIEKKLDRSPNVMQALEAGRRQILAQAYLEQVTGSVAKPTAEEVKSYFTAHPALFSERRVYRLQEIAVAAEANQIPLVQEQLARSKNIGDLVGWLKSNNIKFAANAATKPAEQLPMEILPRLNAMTDGQISVVPAAKGLLIVQLVASQNVPIDLAGATPMIEQFLVNQRRAEMAKKELDQIRGAATIEYMGSFAKEGSVAASTPAPAPAAAAEPAPQNAKGVSQESVTRGVAGLK